MRIARQNGSRGRRSSGRLVAMMVAAAAAPVICVCQAQAASITKADTNTLGTGTDWVGGVSPGVNDIALFDATISTGNEAALTSSANLSWSGINVGTVNGPIVINNSPAFNLSLGIAGINMIAASANLTLNSNLILSPGGQTWTIASGRTLAVNPGTFTRTVGSSVVFNNSGTISTTTLTNSNGILGPWAIVSSSGTAANNTAAGYTYANVSGGSIVAYTGATAGTGFNWTLTNPSTSNYDISAGNGTSAIGTSRTANTVRYTGAATTEYYGSNDTAILTLNGLLNAGGALVLAQNNPSSNPTTSFGKLEIGSTNELVLAAANAGITVAFPIINNGSAASSVTVMGPSVVTLSGLNTFSGGVNLDSGTLVVNSAETAGTSGPLGITGAIFFGGGTLAYGAANSYDYSSRFSNAPNQVYRINTNSANVSYATGFNSSGSSLIKSGAGILTLNASNGNLTGGTTIAGGTVLANNNNALGSAGISTSNVSGAQLSLGSGINLANPLTINGGGVAAQGIVWVPTGNATYSGAINITNAQSAGGDFATNGGVLTVSGPVTSSVPVYVRAGTVQFSNTSNSFSSVIVQAGVAQLGATGAIPSGDGVDLGASGAAVLDLNGFNQTLSVLSKNTSGATVTNNGSNDSLLTLNGTIQFSGVIQNGPTNKINLNISGGTTALGGANTYTGPTNILSGATLQLGTGALDGSLSSASTVINNGTFIFNRNGSITSTNVITGTGLVTKTGAGTQTFNGSSNACVTNVSTGTLAFGLSPSTFSTINVADSAALRIAEINPTTTTLNTTGLNLGTSVSNSLVFDFNSLGDPTTALVNASTGVLTLNGTTNITLANVLGLTTTANNTTLPLMTYASQAGTGSFNLLNSSSGHTSFVLNDTATALYLSVTSVTNYWRGNNGSSWDINATKNWNSSDQVYLEGDVVVFDDSATGTTSIDISAANVNPASVTFNNSTLSYSISSVEGYGIGGLTSLVKYNTGSVTLNTANNYSGGTIVNAGTLNINNASAIGTGALTLNGGTIDSTTSGIVLSTNNTQYWNNSFAFGGTNSLDLGTGNVYLNSSSGLTVSLGNSSLLTVGKIIDNGTHDLILTGTGTLITTSTGTGTGGGTVNGTLNVSSGATLQINRTGAVTASSGDFAVNGLVGAGTITNGASVERWLFVDNTANNTFSGTLANGGTGNLGLNKNGTGTETLTGTISYSGTTTVNAGNLTLNGTDTRSGPTTVTGGTMVIANNWSDTALTTVSGGNLTITAPNSGPGANTNVTGGTLTLASSTALGTTANIQFPGGSTGTLDLALNSGSDVTYTLGTNSVSNIAIQSDVLTPGGGVTHTLGALSLGGSTIAVKSGPNVSGGSPAISTGAVTLSAGSPQTTEFIPTTASITLASVTNQAANGNTHTLDLDGTSTGNSITGGISMPIGGLIVTKSNTSTWTIGGSSTYTGLTSVTGGTLALTGTLGNTTVNVSSGTLSLQDAGAISQNTINFTGGSLVETADNAIGGTAAINTSVPLTFSRPNNYSGDTAVNGGTSTVITITNANGAGTGRLAAATGATTPIFDLHIDGGGTITMPNSFGGNSGITSTIDVNNNTTGSNGIIQLPGVNNYGNGTLNITGGNGYSLAIGGFVNNAGLAGTTLLNPTSANVSIGTYSSTTAFAKTLQLDGTSPGNSITGIVSNGTASTVGIVKSNTSTWTLSGSNTYTGGTNVAGGTLVLANASAFPSNSSLNVASGALVSISNHSTNATYVPVLGGLGNSGTIDLVNNAMLIHNASASVGTINAQAAAAYNQGNWNGSSPSGVITSSVAAADPRHLTAVGVVTGITTTWEGQSVVPTDVLVKYTYYGDADLSGTVDGSDYSRIDNGVLMNLTGWYNGDFNYDGVINGSDYTLIDNAYNVQGASLAAEVASPSASIAAQIAGVSAVPEPASLGLLGIGAIGLLGRRKNRR